MPVGKPPGLMRTTIVATKKKPQSADASGPLYDVASSDVFDVGKVRQLIELMEEFDLSLVDLKQGGHRVRLRRGAEPVVVAAPAVPQPANSAAPSAVSSSGAAARPAEASPASAGTKTVLIKSPMVGTFYASPKPDAPPYVKVGDMVSPDTVVCIIEAMKVFNELPAETSGRIVAVVAESGAPVEFGQALFEVEPR
jgi:acetyl-CoA carboxylase biotin carboxyl carrier protein